MSDWFLIGGLFFPRLTLVVSYLDGSIPANDSPFMLDLIATMCWPRFLIAYWAYHTPGVNQMWVVALIAAGLGELFAGAKGSSARKGGEN